MLVVDRRYSHQRSIPVPCWLPALFCLWSFFVSLFLRLPPDWCRALIPYVKGDFAVGYPQLATGNSRANGFFIMIVNMFSSFSQLWWPWWWCTCTPCSRSTSSASSTCRRVKRARSPIESVTTCLRCAQFCKVDIWQIGKVLGCELSVYKIAPWIIAKGQQQHRLLQERLLHD